LMMHKSAQLYFHFYLNEKIDSFLHLSCKYDHLKHPRYLYNICPTIYVNRIINVYLLILKSHQYAQLIVKRNVTINWTGSLNPNSSFEMIFVTYISNIKKGYDFCVSLLLFISLT
jgi:hypothetical protein